MPKKHIVFGLLILSFSIASCSTLGSINQVENAPSSKNGSLNSTNTEANNQLSECLISELNQIGESISDTFEDVSYDQIMLWFCNGAEFEDILLALETAEQSDTQVEEMLTMLVDGFTWEEIWLLTGINE